MKMTQEQIDQLINMVQSKDLNDVILAGMLCNTFSWSKSVNCVGYRVPLKFRPVIALVRKKLNYWAMKSGGRMNTDNMTHEQILKLWMNGELKFRTDSVY